MTALGFGEQPRCCYLTQRRGGRARYASHSHVYKDRERAEAGVHPAPAALGIDYEVFLAVRGQLVLPRAPYRRSLPSPDSVSSPSLIVRATDAPGSALIWEAVRKPLVKGDDTMQKNRSGLTGRSPRTTATRAIPVLAIGKWDRPQQHIDCAQVR